LHRLSNQRTRAIEFRFGRLLAIAGLPRELVRRAVEAADSLAVESVAVVVACAQAIAAVVAADPDVLRALVARRAGMALGVVVPRVLVEAARAQRGDPLDAVGERKQPLPRVPLIVRVAPEPVQLGGVVVADGPVREPEPVTQRTQRRDRSAQLGQRDRRVCGLADQQCVDVRGGGRDRQRRGHEAILSTTGYSASGYPRNRWGHMSFFLSIDRGADFLRDRRSAMEGEHRHAWEGVARSVHEQTGIGAPVDAFQLARACGLVVLPGGRRASLAGDVVRYDSQARPQRQHGLIAHEVAHYVLRLHGEDDAEAAARYTAGALMLPKPAFDRDVRAVAWNLEQLRQRHPNASAEMIARRLTQVREAVVTVLDEGRVTRRVGSPWMPEPSRRMTTTERELADAALTSGETQRANDLLAAYALFDGSHRRVIVIAEARQLSLRLEDA